MNLQSITQRCEGLEEQNLLSAYLSYAVDHRSGRWRRIRMRIRGPVLGSCQASFVSWFVQGDTFHGHAKRLAQVKAPDAMQGD